MCKSISKEPINWKTKMKLACHNCELVSKLIVSKVNNGKDDMAFRIKCKSCGDEYYVTEDLLREMQENADNKNRYQTNLEKINRRK